VPQGTKNVGVTPSTINATLTKQWLWNKAYSRK
jgi:hypothetical protein